MAIGLKEQTAASVPTPPAGEQYTFMDSSDSKFKRKDSTNTVTPIEPVGSGVDSFNGRVGAVVPVANDYDASEIQNTPAGNIVSTDVQSALNELDTEKAPQTHVGSGGVIEHAIVTGVDAGFMSPSDKTKLDGIATGATTNSPDAYLLARGNHTGTQVAATISDFDSAADARVAIGITAHEAAPDPHPVYATDVDLTAGLAGKANTVHTHVSTDITDFQEAVQDAVGGELLATASVLPTYNDGANTTKWDVLPAGVDHDSLQNYVANKHIDHTTVQIATGATSGLQGGGDISATRNLSLNIDGLTAQTERIDLEDEIAMYDSSQAAHRKMNLRDFLCQRRSLIDQCYTVGDDFNQTSTGSLTANGAGAGNSTQLGTYGMDSVSHALGVSQSDTGTTATGRRTLSSDIGSLTTSLARLRFCARVALEQTSNGTDTFTAYVGFINLFSSGDHTAGAYFRYTHSVNGGKWEAVTAGGGASPSRTANDTGIAADTSYHQFCVEFNEAGTSATFYINGTLVNTISTNIPPLSVAANGTFGYGWKIEKSVGTTQVNISADWYYFEQERSSAR